MRAQLGFGDDEVSTAVRAQIAILENIANDHLVTAGKDISNPGIIGTIGMLLEVSGKGAEIDLAKIPKPDLAAHGMTFEQWVKMYPGHGLCPHRTGASRTGTHPGFGAVGMTAKSIGTVNDSRELRIRYDNHETQVFDFHENGIMHLFYGDTLCPHA